MKHTEENERFLSELKSFANSLGQHIAHNDEWTVRGFIDIF